MWLGYLAVMVAFANKGIRDIDVYLFTTVIMMFVDEYIKEGYIFKTDDLYNHEFPDHEDLIAIVLMLVIIHGIIHFVR